MPYNSITDRSKVGGLIPMEYSNEFINAIAEQSAVLSMGRRLMDMNRYQKTMPVLSALATAYFVNGETGLKQTTDLEWTDEVVTAEEIACIVPVPESTLRDTNVNLWEQIRPELITAMGVVIDNAALYDTNKPTTWATGIVPGAVAAGNNVALGTGADIYDDIMSENGTLTLVEQDGFPVTGHIASLDMKGRLRGLRDSDGQPIFTQNMQAANQYFLDGMPLTFPMNGSASTSYPLISGDWRNFAFSMRQDMEWKVATEAVIQDQAGNIVYNLFQQDMVALRVTMRLGTALPNPINRINTSSTTRFPFAVLTN